MKDEQHKVADDGTTRVETTVIDPQGRARRSIIVVRGNGEASIISDKGTTPEDRARLRDIRKLNSKK